MIKISFLGYKLGLLIIDWFLFFFLWPIHSIYAYYTYMQSMCIFVTRSGKTWVNAHTFWTKFTLHVWKYISCSQTVHVSMGVNGCASVHVGVAKAPCPQGRDLLQSSQLEARFLRGKHWFLIRLIIWTVMVPVFLLYSIKNIDNKLNFVLAAKLPAEDFEEKKKKKKSQMGGLKTWEHPFYSWWINAPESIKSKRSGARFLFEEGKKTYSSQLTELPLTVRY